MSGALATRVDRWDSVVGIFMPGGYRRTKNDTGRIIAALEAKLRDYPGDNDFADGEDWI